MKQYLSFFRMRLLAGLQYRAAALAGMSTQLVWGTMEVLLYRAFYLESPENFALWHLEPELADSVQQGTVAYELVRPGDLYGMWMARSLALRLSRAALRCLPILLVAALVPAPYGLRLTVSPGTLALFLVSMVLMLVLVCAYTMVLYGLGFYLESTNGVRWLSLAASDLLGGAIVPLPFLPGPLRTIAALSPFGSMQNVPLRIYGGDIAGTEIPAAMGLQALWCLLLILAGWILMNRGLRRCVVAGG